MKKWMNRWVSLLIFMCLSAVQPVCQVRAEEMTGNPDEPAGLYARSAVLMDADSGRVLFGKEEDTIRPMASTTKIMTCILALENMTDQQKVKVSDHAVCQPKVRLGVKGGEDFYLKDLLYSLMLESHNDSAVVIAEGIAESVEAFVQLMNEKAEELGCKDTYFITPNGLDAQDEKGVHSTTAVDLSRIMKYCIMESPKKEEFLAITRTKNYSFQNVKGDRRFSCNNHNAFLTMMEGALSGKTGFTADAGYCYVGALRSGERTYIVALLACGWPNNKNYKWKDTRKLMEYGLLEYEYQDVWQKTTQAQLPVEGGVSPASICSKDSKVTVKVEEEPGLKVLLGKHEKVETRIKMEEHIKAPVKRGQTLGKMSYLLNGEVIKSYNITAQEDIEKRDYVWCMKKMFRRILLTAY